MIRPKKGVLFPEIGPVKIFLTKKPKKKNKTEDKKQKKLKKKKQYLWKI